MVALRQAQVSEIDWQNNIERTRKELTANTRNNNLRLFIACLLPEEALSALASAQQQFLKAGAPKLRWVRPEGIHLTLKFLGEVPQERVQAIDRRLGEAVVGVRPFDLALDQLGTFGGRNGPRVLWAGIRGDLDRVGELQQRIEAAMAALDFSREDRAFRPHLTLARASNDLMAVQQRHLEGLTRTVELPEVAIPVSQVSLMRSILDRSGAIYHELASFPLHS